MAACFLSSFAQNIVVVLCRVWDIYIYKLEQYTKDEVCPGPGCESDEETDFLVHNIKELRMRMHKADFIERRRTVLDSQRFGKIILDKNLELLNISRYLDLIPFCNES